MATDDEQSSKVTRSRERMRAGLRPVQFWVPDTRLASFAADLRRQCLELNGAASEAEVLGLTEEAAGQVEGWT
ncbi:hypothetical protein LBMAG30_25090 [Comamonadaceae bacterium]|nr:hypothetical protein LBMAG30_25090 [Comamonadaceae bacterium]